MNEDLFGFLIENVEVLSGMLVAALAALSTASAKLRAQYKKGLTALGETLAKLKDIFRGGGPGGPTAAALIAVMLVSSGCSGLVDRHYGPADTNATDAYQLVGRYIYLGTAVSAYVEHPSADPSLKADLCALDSAAHQSLSMATNTLLSGGDKALVGFQVAGVALRNLSLTVLDDFSLTQTAENVGQRTIVLATIAVDAITRMRIFRKTFLEPQLNAFADTATDPGAADFKVINGKAEKVNASIQSAC